MIHQEIPIGKFVATEPSRQRSEIEAVLEDYLLLKDKHLGGQMEIVAPVLDDWILNRAEVAKSNRINGATYNPIARIKINELWNVTVETGRVDILIWRNLPEKSAVIIENKSNGAGDRPNQIYRYWHRELFLWEPSLWTSTDKAKILERNRRFHVVYLPTDGGKSPETQSTERPCGMETANPFEHVPLKCRIFSLAALMALWERQAVPHIPPENHRLRAFLSQYQELWTK